MQFSEGKWVPGGCDFFTGPVKLEGYLAAKETIDAVFAAFRFDDSRHRR